ncbi:MAG TPA: LapA family protein [Amycolatopsis sp.]|jgi:uncharacterized integral membrane protein|nr:LapA family protein [Amycolatopsis sp.]
MAQQPQTSSTREPAIRVSTRGVVGLVLFAIVLTFIVQNRQSVQIYLFTTSVSSPLWVALAVVLILGMACGFLLTRRHR